MMQNDVHQRECWNCKNIATHASRVAPGVCCSKCGSQDTRVIKGWPELLSDAPKHVDGVWVSIKGDTMQLMTVPMPEGWIEPFTIFGWGESSFAVVSNGDAIIDGLTVEEANYLACLLNAVTPSSQIKRN